MCAHQKGSRGSICKSVLACQVLSSSGEGIPTFVLGGSSAKVYWSAKLLSTSSQGIYAL